MSIFPSNGFSTKSKGANVSVLNLYNDCVIRFESRLPRMNITCINSKFNFCDQLSHLIKIVDYKLHVLLKIRDHINFIISY